MNTATRTSTSRKAMRVATVFTGAAAAAVGFAPAALAAPGHAAAQDHPAQTTGKAQAMRPDTGSIKSEGCGTTTWLHIQYSSPIRTLCKAFGFKGKMDPMSGNTAVVLPMEAQCGGNNYGTIFASGKITFGPGTGYRSFSRIRYVSAVSITHWSSKTTRCAWPR